MIFNNFYFIFKNITDKKNYQIYKYNIEKFYFPGKILENSPEKNSEISIRAETDCIIASISHEQYIKLITKDDKKQKQKDLKILCDRYFFNVISPIIFEKYYFNSFKSIEFMRNDFIFNQNEENKFLYFIKEGSIKIEFIGSVIDLHNNIKFLVDEIFEKNPLKLNYEKLNKIKNSYLNDPELVGLQLKENQFKEKMNKIEKYEIYILKNLLFWLLKNFI